MNIKYLKLITTCELYIIKDGIIVATRIIEDYDDEFIKYIQPLNDEEMNVYLWEDNKKDVKK